MNPTDADDMTAMVEQYLRTALWTWVDEDGGAPFPGDEGYVDVTEVFDLRSIVHAISECRDFCEYVAECAEDDSDRIVGEPTWEEWQAASEALTAMDPGQAGHDFWLTREHHGAGFWDRGLGVAGARLTDAAHTFGACDLWVSPGEPWSATLG